MKNHITRWGMQVKDKFIITIGREYGSGGGEIGRRLSKYFNIPCYDKELLTIVAKESGYCKEYFEKYDEKPLKVVKKIDKERASYYKYYTDSYWGNANNYHICLDTSFIGIDEATRIIIDFIERRYK